MLLNKTDNSGDPFQVHETQHQRHRSKPEWSTPLCYICSENCSSTHLNISEDIVSLRGKVILHECLLTSTIPQVQHQISQQSGKNNHPSVHNLRNPHLTCECSTSIVAPSLLVSLAMKLAKMMDLSKWWLILLTRTGLKILSPHAGLARARLAHQ